MDTSTLPSLGTGRFQLGEPSAPDQLLVKQQDQINHLERGKRRAARQGSQPEGGRDNLAWLNGERG
jgi:hypothetical protein